jgi:hypothetical protein
VLPPNDFPATLGSRRLANELREGTLSTTISGSELGSNSKPRSLPRNPPNGYAQQRPVRHLNQIELGRRWGISPRTLERWRWRKLGPPYEDRRPRRLSA